MVARSQRHPLQHRLGVVRRHLQPVHLRVPNGHHAGSRIRTCNGAAGASRAHLPRLAGDDPGFGHLAYHHRLSHRLVVELGPRSGHRSSASPRDRQTRPHRLRLAGSRGLQRLRHLHRRTVRLHRSLPGHPRVSTQHRGEGNRPQPPAQRDRLHPLQPDPNRRAIRRPADHLPLSRPRG